MKLASLIKAKRVEKGYSQEYMALKIGISQAAYSRLENKAEDKPFRQVLEICKLLDIDKRDLEKIFSYQD
jgi:DNA-binding XRE family transcriptional regulator